MSATKNLLARAQEEAHFEALRLSLTWAEPTKANIAKVADWKFHCAIRNLRYWAFRRPAFVAASARARARVEASP